MIYTPEHWFFVDALLTEKLHEMNLEGETSTPEFDEIREFVLAGRYYLLKETHGEDSQEGWSDEFLLSEDCREAIADFFGLTKKFG